MTVRLYDDCRLAADNVGSPTLYHGGIHTCGRKHSATAARPRHLDIAHESRRLIGRHGGDCLAGSACYDRRLDAECVRELNRRQARTQSPVSIKPLIRGQPGRRDTRIDETSAGSFAPAPRRTSLNACRRYRNGLYPEPETRIEPFGFFYCRLIGHQYGIAATGKPNRQQLPRPRQSDCCRGRCVSLDSRRQGEIVFRIEQVESQAASASAIELVSVSRQESPYRDSRLPRPDPEACRPAQRAP